MLMYIIMSFMVTLFVSYMKSVTNESSLLNMLLQIFIYGIPSFWIIKTYFPSSTSRGTVPSSVSRGTVPSSVSRGTVPSSVSRGTVPSSSEGFISFLYALYIGLFIIFKYTLMTNIDNDVWIFLLNILIITPICEELFFRGFIYNYIKEILLSLRGTKITERSELGVSQPSQLFNSKYPIIISAIIFSIYHINPTTMLVALIAGILLGYLYHRTKSLKLCISIHSLYNLCVVLLTNL